MTPYKKNVTESIDNINKLEELIKTNNLEELEVKINYLYRLAGGK